MRHWRNLILAVMAAAVLAPGPAAAYVAWNNFTILRIGADRFEVLPRGGLNAIDGWCAVGDYVITVLSLDPATPIWRISEPPRPRGASIVFSLGAEGAASANGLMQIGSSHVWLTAAAARAFCPQSLSYWQFL